MFIALEIKDNSEFTLPNFKKVFIGTKIDIKKVKIKNSAPFYVAQIPNYKRIPWKKLRMSLGRLSNKVLLPADIQVPSNCGIKAINITDNLHAISLLNTAHLVAKYSSIPAKKFKITIVDRDGIYLKNIEKIINCASQIRVITNNLKKYEPVANYIYNYWGASIFLSSDLQIATNSNIIISPFEEITGTNSLILTLDKSKSLTCNTAIATRVKLPNEYLKYLPNGIDEHDFASVLYDEYKFKSLSDISLDKMIINGCEQSIYEISKLMDCQYSLLDSKH